MSWFKAFVHLSKDEIKPKTYNCRQWYLPRLLNLVQKINLFNTRLALDIPNQLIEFCVPTQSIWKRVQILLKYPFSVAAPFDALCGFDAVCSCRLKATTFKNTFVADYFAFKCWIQLSLSQMLLHYYYNLHRVVRR